MSALQLCFEQGRGASKKEPRLPQISIGLNDNNHEVLGRDLSEDHRGTFGGRHQFHDPSKSHRIAQLSDRLNQPAELGAQRLQIELSIPLPRGSA